MDFHPPSQSHYTPGDVTLCGDETAPFSRFLGAVAVLFFSCVSRTSSVSNVSPRSGMEAAAYGTAKSGVVASMGVMGLELVMNSIVPVVVAGVLGLACGLAGGGHGHQFCGRYWCEVSNEVKNHVKQAIPKRCTRCTYWLHLTECNLPWPLGLLVLLLELQVNKALAVDFPGLVEGLSDLCYFIHDGMLFQSSCYPRSESE